jgi:seryl-tRNA synthetase
MIYIIISNIGLAIMMIYIYFRYSHFRIASSNEIKSLREKNDKQTLELREFDAKLLSSIKGYQDKVEALLIELGKVRAEKEKEIELKNSVEKKYEILKQKNADYELIHSEISTAIMSIVNDTHETAKNLERDIFNKIDNTAKKELEENQKLISKINQNVVDFVTKFNSTQNKLIRDKEDIKFYELFQNINGYLFIIISIHFNIKSSSNHINIFGNIFIGYLLFYKL